MTINMQKKKLTLIIIKTQKGKKAKKKICVNK